MSLPKTQRAKRQFLKPSSSFCAFQIERGFNRSLPNRPRKLSVLKPPFEAESNLVRIDRYQIAFLRHKIYWQNVVLPSDNHEVGRRDIRMIRKLDRHMTRVTEHFVITFPF